MRIGYRPLNTPDPSQQIEDLVTAVTGSRISDTGLYYQGLRDGARTMLRYLLDSGQITMEPQVTWVTVPGNISELYVDLFRQHPRPSRDFMEGLAWNAPYDSPRRRFIEAWDEHNGIEIVVED